MIPRLHLVTDDRVLAEGGFPARAQAVGAGAGARAAIHLRGPGTPARRLWEVARDVKDRLQGTGCPLFVNDRVDLALLLRPAGVHLGARSLPPERARALFGPAGLLGRSVHGAGEVAALGPEGLESLDYLVVGTLFATPSHPGREGAGPERVREVAEVAGGLPVLGIGGITPERIPEVLEAGAHGVAVLRAVWDADDPGAAAADLVAALPEIPGKGEPQGASRDRT